MNNKEKLIELLKSIADYLLDNGVVPVVRCADCRHFRCNLRPDGYLPEGVGETECVLFHCGMDYTDYCSFGEKHKENK